MISNELLSYINQQLARGADKESIKNTLLNQGWLPQDLEAAFAEVGGYPAQFRYSTNPSNATKNWTAITSLVFGILGLVAWIIPIVGLPVAVAGLILGIFGLKSLKSGMATTGIILSSIGLLLSIVNASIGFYQGLNQYGFLAPEDREILEQGVVLDNTVPTLPNTLEEQRYLNTKYVFSLNQPKGWKSDEGGQFGTLVIFFNPQADRAGTNSFSANINVVTESAQGLDLDDYVESTQSFLAKGFTNYERAENKELNLNGSRARLIGSRFEQGVYKLRNFQLIVVEGGQAFIITGTALESDWDRYSDLIESSLRTFRLEG